MSQHLHYSLRAPDLFFEKPFDTFHNCAGLINHPPASGNSASVRSVVRGESTRQHVGAAIALAVTVLMLQLLYSGIPAHVVGLKQFQYPN
jgi:hypothetical protein